LIGYTTAFNEAVNLVVSSLRTGQAIALPNGVAAADGIYLYIFVLIQQIIMNAN
jgi:hypothetical protein